MILQHLKFLLTIVTSWMVKYKFWECKTECLTYSRIHISLNIFPLYFFKVKQNKCFCTIKLVGENFLTDLWSVHCQNWSWIVQECSRQICSLLILRTVHELIILRTSHLIFMGCPMNVLKNVINNFWTIHVCKTSSWTGCWNIFWIFHK